MSTIICDIVIPVYNALTQTERCIKSVIQFSDIPFRLIVVNDCSDSLTTQRLRELKLSQTSNPELKDFILLQNEKNLGFLDSANRGLNFTAPHETSFKIILNSDTVVTPNWLSKFKSCFENDSRIGLACPTSNNAENLSLPIPEGWSWLDMASALSELAPINHYPDVSTAIGFCMGIRSSLISSVGLFDKIFAPGYAEDSDLHFRVLANGFRSVLVSDCFIYHESHASFSKNKERLVAKNRPVFDQRWSAIYNNDLEYHDKTDPLGKSRECVKCALQKPTKPHDVLFIIATTKLFGGIVVVYELVNRLLLLGVRANAIVLSEESSIEMQLLWTPIFRPDSTWHTAPPHAAIYVATHFETTPYALFAQGHFPESKTLYLLQGYESWFPGATIEEVVNTYRAIPNRVAVSNWVKEMVERWGVECTVIPNGVDTSFFYPVAPDCVGKSRTDVEPITVLTMLRNDPQGGWRISSHVLKQIKDLRPNIRIIAIGDLAKHPEVAAAVDEAYLHADRKLMRELYRKSDIALDCSMVQGFGLLGLEAMASGLAVVTSNTGGVREYANEENSLLVQLGSEEGFVKALLKLIDNPEILSSFKLKGYQTAINMDWESRAILYKKLFEQVISSGNAPTLNNLSEMNAFLFKRHIRQLEQSNALIRAEKSLSLHLKSASPLGILEIFKLPKDKAELEALQSTHVGKSIGKLYENARAVIATVPPTETPQLPPYDVRNSGPLLESVIEVTNRGRR